MSRQGKPPEKVFVSPNVSEVPKSNNLQVFEAYTAFELKLLEWDQAASWLRRCS